jgi:hypothetical protein
MDALVIEGKNDTPGVCLNELGALEITGRSYPEDAAVFYAPLLHWMTQYLQQQTKPTFLKLKLEYFNTSSSKQLFKLLSLAENAKARIPVTVQWYYQTSDTDMKESGERFSKLVNLPFEFIAC